MKFLFNTLAVSADSVLDYRVYEIEEERYHVEVSASAAVKPAHFTLCSIDGLWITYHPKFIDMAPVLGERIRECC